MHEVLARWHADHVNFAKRLNLLEDQVELFHAGGSPKYELMLDVIYYMMHYPDVLHHPREDLVFAKIKERAGSAGPTLDELTEQHARLRESGRELVRILDDIVFGAKTQERYAALRRQIATQARLRG